MASVLSLPQFRNHMVIFLIILPRFASHKVSLAGILSAYAGCFQKILLLSTAVEEMEVLYPSDPGEGVGLLFYHRH